MGPQKVLRKRAVPGKEEMQWESGSEIEKDKKEGRREPEIPEWLRLVLMLFTAAFTILGFIYIGVRRQRVMTPETIWTKEKLALFDGSHPAKPLILAILGDVFDVTDGKKHYEAGAAYNHFCGRDASRAFVSGNFTGDGLAEDVSDFSSEQLRSLEGWRGFYFKTYKHVGKLVGRYYNASGHATKELRKLEMRFRKAEAELAKQKAEEAKYPGCNSRWSQNEGGKVWCESGFPRKIFRAVSPSGGAQPTEKPTRCACFEEDQLDLPGLMLYPGCDPQATSCVTSPPGNS